MAWQSLGYLAETVIPPKKVRGNARVSSRNSLLTLSNDTRSAAWRRVRPEISSTIRPMLGSTSTGGALEDGEVSVVVESHLDRPVREGSLALTASENHVRREHRERTYRGRDVDREARRVYRQRLYVCVLSFHKKWFIRKGHTHCH